jgi:hypothetical protein
VREAVAKEPPPRVSWLDRLTRPAWALALGGSAVAAGLVAVLVLGRTAPPAPTETAVAVAMATVAAGANATDAPAGEDWELITDVAGSIDLDEVSAIGGGVAPGAADAAIMDLSADERGEIARIIREELGKERSS